MNYFEPDPHGDVLLVLKRPNQHQLVESQNASDKPHQAGEAIQPISGEDEKASNKETCGRDEVRFRLSSKHLSLASPVFNAMLSGGWKESITPVDRSEKNQNEEAQDGQLREITATEWDTEAFLLLLNIFHGRHRQVPLVIDLDMLVKMSVLVDYYKSYEITEFFMNIWVNKLLDTLPNSHGKDSMKWLFVSWVTSHADIFKKMTELAMRESNGPLETWGLPLPLALLRLGEMQLIKPFGGRSVKDVKDTVLGLRSPIWYTKDRQHECILAGHLEPTADAVWEKLVGLSLKDFRPQY
ncbi:hypothetical protein EsDP_00001493 [Epichloe bromicola]|uniref:BTB domain-containing protein n=1 Tax=Epichloe bromicola TaxID=79588 RepID=A0ABQ0CI24_9HYPO